MKNVIHICSGVELTAADTLTVDMQLTVGNTSETVQMTAEAQLLRSHGSVYEFLRNDKLDANTATSGLPNA